MKRKASERFDLNRRDRKTQGNWMIFSGSVGEKIKPDCLNSPAGLHLLNFVFQ
jgi:hypothetical protein